MRLSSGEKDAPATPVVSMKSSIGCALTIGTAATGVDAAEVSAGGAGGTATGAHAARASKGKRIRLR